jgi:hypothetical protein
MIEVSPGVFIGNSEDALSITKLKSYNIDLIIVAAKGMTLDK